MPLVSGPGSSSTNAARVPDGVVHTCGVGQVEHADLVPPSQRDDVRGDRARASVVTVRPRRKGREEEQPHR